jgi:NAD(P)-dependent dehydrogenase (short-subunit alcohol dehydrogenase family)
MGVLGGKVTLVAVARRGVGVAIARSLVEECAAVIVNYLKSEDAQRRSPATSERGG